MTAATYVVTGTSGGIGLHVARYLLAHGARVVGVSRRETPLEHQQFVHVQGDLTETGTADKIVATAGPRVAGVLFNAGVLDPLVSIADANIADWKRSFDVNFFSIVELTSRLVPALRSTEGRLLYVSSGAATSSTYAWSAYGCAKAAINRFSQDVAAEEPSVTTIAVAPGKVDTNMQAFIRSEKAARMKPEDKKMFTDAYEKGQLVNPEDSGILYGNLLLHGDKSLSGKVLRYSDDILASYAKGVYK